MGAGSNTVSSLSSVSKSTFAPCDMCYPWWLLDSQLKNPTTRVLSCSPRHLFFFSLQDLLGNQLCVVPTSYLSRYVQSTFHPALPHHPPFSHLFTWKMGIPSYFQKPQLSVPYGLGWRRQIGPTPSPLSLQNQRKSRENILWEAEVFSKSTMSLPVIQKALHIFSFQWTGQWWKLFLSPSIHFLVWRNFCKGLSSVGPFLC